MEENKLPKDLQETLDVLNTLQIDENDTKQESIITLMPGRFIKCPVCGKLAPIIKVKNDQNNVPAEVGYACSNKECNSEGYLPFLSLYNKEEQGSINYTGSPSNKFMLAEFLGQTIINLCNKENVDKVLISNDIQARLYFNEDFESNTSLKRIQGEFLAGYLGENRIQCWVTPFLSDKKFIANEVLYKINY